MSKYNYEITDLDALANHDGGKFVITEEIKTTKTKPNRTLIKAALTLGQALPGVSQKATDEVEMPAFMEKKD